MVGPNGIEQKEKKNCSVVITRSLKLAIEKITVITTWHNIVTFLDC